MWSSAFSFFSVLWLRGVSKLKLICYQLRGEFWKDSTAWDFYSMYRLLSWVQKKAQFSFCRQLNESFSLWNCSSRNSTFFSSRRSAWPVMKCNQGCDVLEHFEVHFYSMVKEISFLKLQYSNVWIVFYNFYTVPAEFRWNCISSSWVK